MLQIAGLQEWVRERLCSAAGPINHILIEHWMLFQATWQIGMALVTPHSNTRSASFSFTSFIESPGNTHSLSLLLVLTDFSACWMFRCPLTSLINTLLITQQKPAVNLKIPFSIPVKRCPWAVWLCTTRAVLHGSCDTVPGEQKWQQMSQEMPPSLPRVNLGSSYTVTTRGSYWHVTSRAFLNLSLKIRH